jgi:hypothetical protein
LEISFCLRRYLYQERGQVNILISRKVDRGDSGEEEEVSDSDNLKRRHFSFRHQKNLQKVKSIHLLNGEKLNPNLEDHNCLENIHHFYLGFSFRPQRTLRCPVARLLTDEARRIS